MKKITWHAAGLTDRGKTRQYNEDNFSISSDLRLFVVADGMGGTENGALASRLAVEEMETCRTENGLDLSDPDAIKNFLVDAIARANGRVVTEQAASKQKMGTTIVAAMQSDDGLLHIAHVGDSRAYLVRNSDTQILTIDHSVVMEMYMQGRLSKQQAKDSQFKHLITRCLGHDADVQCDYMVLEMQPGDWIILASDGLPAAVDDEDLADVFKSVEDANHACKDLVEKTLNNGAPDNVTVLCIHYASTNGEEPTSQPAKAEQWFQPSNSAE